MVRKIRASITDGEQQEKPINTPCSAIAEKSAGHKSLENKPAAALMSEPEEDISGAAATGMSSEKAVQSCGS